MNLWNLRLLLFETQALLLNLQSSKLYTGTKKLIDDVSKLLLILAPVIAVISIIYCMIRKMGADEHEAPMWKKRAVGVGVAMVIVVSATGIVALVNNYYG